MILFPSIDLKDGYVMRYVRGAGEAVQIDTLDPTTEALAFEKQGFKWLHLVDLNGATTGEMKNIDAVESILKTASIPVQLGGGIRDMAGIEYWLQRGVQRVVVGTIAQKNPALVREACTRFPGRIVVSIDARGGQVTLSGWTQTTEMKALELGLRFEDAGAAAIIYTDIGRKGTFTGINVEAMADLAFALTTPVIASGGLASLNDIEELRNHQTSGIVGVVCGRALYDGRVDPAQALKTAGDQKEFV